MANYGKLYKYINLHGVFTMNKKINKNKHFPLLILQQTIHFPLENKQYLIKYTPTTPATYEWVHYRIFIAYTFTSTYVNMCTGIDLFV